MKKNISNLSQKNFKSKPKIFPNILWSEISNQVDLCYLLFVDNYSLFNLNY